MLFIQFQASRLPSGLLYLTTISDVPKHISAVLTLLVALRWWIILCRNVHILSNSVKQTLFGMPCFYNTHAYISPPSFPKQFAKFLLYQFNFLWSKGECPIHILILLKVLGVLTWFKILFSGLQFESRIWIWNYFFYAVIKINLCLKIFLSQENQVHHVLCVSWNIQKS